MTAEHIKQILKGGEGVDVEFKESRSGLPRTLFDTICAFLNTKGGTILLGVDDGGNVSGIKKDKVNKLKKDIANLANNSQKLSPPFMIYVEEFEIEDKAIVSILVPESSQVHKSGNEIFEDRIEFSNPNNPKVFGKIDPKHFTPVAKNPSISKLMLQMGRVEEVGSGMRNVYKYLPHYSEGAAVEFIDGDIFSTIIHLGSDMEQVDKETIKKSGEKDFGKISERFRKRNI